ncbi:hypothetical protein [Streptacidiphilus sp. EB129]|uniref:hypothetical protein n=1 Tax=Streptacidiphilus sp. EB129 TaxID=3156262 RepID=UPI003516DAF5
MLPNAAPPNAAPPNHLQIPPPPAGHLPQDAASGSAGPRSRKGVYLTLAVVGWLVVAAGTATTVVAVGRTGNARTVAAAATPSATPSAVPSTTAPAPVPTAAPSPTSTVRGSVSGSTHSGDLRFFLLPVPSDAEAYGDTDGKKLSVDDIAKELGDVSTSKRVLNDYGCDGGADRTYRTNDGSYTIDAQLIHFDGSSHAAAWVTGLSFSKGSSFSVTGVSNAQAYAFDPGSAQDQGQLIGISHVGDVEYEISVTGTGTLPHSLLAPLMQREEQRLGSGT